MRMRSPVVQFLALSVSLGALATTSLGVSRPPSRTSPRDPAPAPTPNTSVRPTPRPIPRASDTFITIDRVRYRVTCSVVRTIGGIAMEDGTVPVWTTVTLTLRRTDGRTVTASVLPQLTISQSGEPTTINLAPVPTLLPSAELIFTGSGSNSWANDVQLTGRLTVPQRRGAPARATIRTIPFTLNPLP